MADNEDNLKQVLADVLKITIDSIDDDTSVDTVEQGRIG